MNTDNSSKKIQERKQTGVVTTAKTDKTRVMKFYTTFRVKKYEKVLTHAKKCMFHDPENLSSPGDTVEIVFCRPISANKRWLLKRIIKKAGEVK